MGTSKGYSPPTGHLWADSKRSVTAMDRNNYSSSSIGKALSNFSKANSSKGFSRKANSVISTSGSKILSFSGLVGTIGLYPALDEIGLTHLRGSNPQSIFEGLTDYFSEGTNSFQESIANQAMQEYMQEIMGSVRSAEEMEVVLSKLEADTFIRDYLIKYIETSFFANFAEKINSMCEDINEAIKMQDRIKDFIRVNISENFKPDGLMDIDWKGREGRKYIEEKCEEVWEIFELWGE